jgi:hypothetical protein
MANKDKPEDKKEEVKDDIETKDLGSLDEEHKKAQAEVDEPEVEEEVDELDEDEEEEVEDKPKDEVIAPPVEPEEDKPVDETKVKIKGADGKTYEVSSIDDLPDDFEPTSYKELAKASVELAEKAQTDKANSAKKEEERLKKEEETRVTALQESWNTEIKELTKSGLIPKDKGESEKLVQKVYDYMGDELKDGNLIEKFSTGFKAYMYDQDSKDRVKKDAVEKKDKGSMVMGSGGTGGKPKYMEAPPSGLTLDQVHHQVLQSL